MALTNNTKFRRRKLTINKKINGSIDTAGGFPVTVLITNAFPGYPALSDTEFQTLSDADYNTRLTAFYAHVQTLYPFWTPQTALNVSSGTDAVLCPIDNSASPVPVVQSVSAAFEPVNGGTLDDHLTWDIVLTEVVTQDTPYYFEVDLFDKNSNFLRTETVFGVILSGQSSHLATTERYYIPEASDPAIGPLSATAKIATVQF